MAASSGSRSISPAMSFTGAAIDRATELRMDPSRVADLLAGDDAVALTCSAEGVAIDPEAGRLARTPWQGEPDAAVLLGVDADAPVLAVRLEDDEAMPAGAVAMSLREAGTALSREESGLAAYLVALTNWHRRHPFCSVCGHATQIAEVGLSRRCPNCGSTHFPRTDPVVIMSVEFDGRLLLGSRVGWPDDRYSVLAGFVAAGETPEEAVLREVREESGIEARDAGYVGSQPWPFPASLMLGFHATADRGEPRPGGDNELNDVRWFPRDEVIAMQQGQSRLHLPPEVSIARQLIDRWVTR